MIKYTHRITGRAVAEFCVKKSIYERNRDNIRVRLSKGSNKNYFNWYFTIGSGGNDTDSNAFLALVCNSVRFDRKPVTYHMNKL